MADLVNPLFIALILAAAAWLALPAHSALVRRLHVLSEPETESPDEAGLNRSANSRPSGRQPGLRDPAMVLELVAAMLEAGSGLGRALELVAVASVEEIQRPLRPVVAALAIGADWDTAWRTSSELHPDIVLLRDALGFAAYTGAPSASILYAQAARIRRDRFRQAEKRAASLGVKLVIPLGLCSLPAFICLGVVPVLLALVPSGS